MKMNLDPAVVGKTGFSLFRKHTLDHETKVLKIKVRVAGILQGLRDQAEKGMSNSVITLLKILTSDEV